MQSCRKKVHQGQIQYSAEERRFTKARFSTALKKEDSLQGRPVTSGDFCRVYTRDVGEEGAYAGAFHDESDVKAISLMSIKGKECFQSG